MFSFSSHHIKYFTKCWLCSVLNFNCQPTNNNPRRAQLPTQYVPTETINKCDKTQHTETQTMKLKKFDDTNIENPVNNARNFKGDANIENPVNNFRNFKDISDNNDLCQRHNRSKDAKTVYNNTTCTNSITLTQLQKRNQRSIDAKETPTQLEKRHQRFEDAKKKL